MSNSAQSHFGRATVICETESSVTSSGLFSFGLCAILINLFQTGLFPMTPAILAMGMMYGGASQILIGLMEWHKNNVFGAATFVSFGLFWLSLIGFLVLPEAGWGTLPAGTVLSAYFLFWGAFAALLLASAVKINRSVRLMFILLLSYFILFFFGEATGSSVVTRLANYCGLASGGAALFAGAALIVNQAFGRSTSTR